MTSDEAHHRRGPQRSPPISPPAARSRWARTGPRMRSASPSCCRRARASTSITCRATRLDDTLRGLIAVKPRRARAGAAHGRPPRRLEGRGCNRSSPARPPRPASRKAARPRRRSSQRRPAPTPTPPPCCATVSLRDAGIREIGLAAYPEGHPRIASDVLTDGLARQDRAGPQPRPRHLRRHAVLVRAEPHRRVLRPARSAPSRACPSMSACPARPIPRGSIKFAQACGVSASLRAMTAHGMGAVRLFTHTDPVDQLHAVARHCTGRRDRQRRRHPPLHLRRHRARRPLAQQAIRDGVMGRGRFCRRASTR